MNRLIQSAVLIVAVASAPAWAQSKSEIQRMQPYLGVLAPDCSNYMLPQLKTPWRFAGRAGRRQGGADRTQREARAQVLRRYTSTGIRNRIYERGRGR